jgi:hypothetical protein
VSSPKVDGLRVSSVSCERGGTIKSVLGRLQRGSLKGEGVAVDSEGDFLSVGTLASVKKIALRRRVWFKCLSRVERGVIDLTVRCVDVIKSKTLAKVVTAIMEKLQFAMESMADRLVRTIGLALTRKISSIAVGWGVSSASKWADDPAFARYLAFSSVNDTSVYRGGKV